ncbi:MAG: flavodoxin family protein [Gammaproteobacteria bacterium]|jgi:multimeric flavodoxin WrbA
MKVLAINSSPRGNQGCTFRMLQPLLKGMQEAGAETELVNLGELKINHCLGCFACWFETPGQCVIKDDVAPILEKFADADLVIYGTPLYVFTMSGLMKNLLDRSVPLASPYMIENKDMNGITTHPPRHSGKTQKMLLVSPAGFPEFEHFTDLVATFKRLANMAYVNYLGEILRPAAAMLLIHQPENPLVKQYLDALKQAGKQLITNEKIDDETMKILHDPWISPEDFRKTANEHLRQMLNE